VKIGFLFFSVFVFLFSLIANSNIAHGQIASQADAKKAVEYIKLGYTNGGLCPSEHILRNISSNQPISVTVQYAFSWDPGFSRTKPAPETEIIFLAPGQRKVLKYRRNNCVRNSLIKARVVGAYFGR